MNIKKVKTYTFMDFEITFKFYSRQSCLFISSNLTYTIEIE